MLQPLLVFLMLFHLYRLFLLQLAYIIHLQLIYLVLLYFLNNLVKKLPFYPVSAVQRRGQTTAPAAARRPPRYAPRARSRRPAGCASSGIPSSYRAGSAYDARPRHPHNAACTSTLGGVPQHDMHGLHHALDQRLAVGHLGNRRRPAHRRPSTRRPPPAADIRMKPAAPASDRSRPVPRRGTARPVR